MRLSKREKDIYSGCLGRCAICLMDGGCDLQNKLKEEVV